MAARSGPRRPPAPSARTGESSGAPRVLAQTSRSLLEQLGDGRNARGEGGKCGGAFAVFCPGGSGSRFSPRRKGESIKTPEQLPRRVGAEKLAGVFVLCRHQKTPSSSRVFPLGGAETRQKSPPLKKGTPAGGGGEQGSGSGGGVAGRKRESAGKLRQDAKNPAYMLAGSRQDRDRSASHAARFPSAVSSPPWRNPSSSSAATASRSALGSGSDWRSVPR